MPHKSRSPDAISKPSSRAAPDLLLTRLGWAPHCRGQNVGPAKGAFVDPSFVITPAFLLLSLGPHTNNNHYYMENRYDAFPSVLRLAAIRSAISTRPQPRAPEHTPTMTPRRPTLLLCFAVCLLSTDALRIAGPHPHASRDVRLLTLRGGASDAASPLVGCMPWLRVLRRLLFPGNPPRPRAEPVAAPPPPPPAAQPAAAKPAARAGRRSGKSRSGGAVGSVNSVHSKAEFDKLLSSTPQKRLVVVDFAASWCGPCQQIAPKFAAMAAALPHVCFVKVDVDECKDLQSQYGVTAMPTFKMLKGGKEVGSMQGADEGALREKIEALAGKPDRWAAAGSGRQL